MITDISLDDGVSTQVAYGQGIKLRSGYETLTLELVELILVKRHNFISDVVLPPLVVFALGFRRQLNDKRVERRSAFVFGSDFAGQFVDDLVAFVSRGDEASTSRSRRRTAQVGGGVVEKRKARVALDDVLRVANVRVQ